MNSWKLLVEHGACQKPHYEAETSCGTIQRYIRIRLNVEMPRAPTTAELLDTARHEMIHALLEPMQTLLFCRNVTEDELDTAAHEVLRKLWDLLPS
jgi:hypothetical protein